jgi:hypothetical protein
LPDTSRLLTELGCAIIAKGTGYGGLVLLVWLGELVLVSWVRVGGYGGRSVSSNMCAGGPDYVCKHSKGHRVWGLRSGGGAKSLMLSKL